MAGGGMTTTKKAEDRVVGQGLARELCSGVPHSTYEMKILRNLTI